MSGAGTRSWEVVPVEEVFGGEVGFGVRAGRVMFEG